MLFIFSSRVKVNLPLVNLNFLIAGFRYLTITYLEKIEIIIEQEYFSAPMKTYILKLSKANNCHEI